MDQLHGRALAQHWNQKVASQPPADRWAQDAARWRQLRAGFVGPRQPPLRVCTREAYEAHSEQLYVLERELYNHLRGLRHDDPLWRNADISTFWTTTQWYAKERAQDREDAFNMAYLTHAGQTPAHCTAAAFAAAWLARMRARSCSSE